MYNKNLSRRAGLTPEFENGVKTFIEWAKGQRRHMDGDKIRRPCRKCKNTKYGTPNKVSYHLCMRRFMLEYYNWTSHGENIVQDYFEAPSVSQVSEEPTPTGHVEGIPDDGRRSCPVDAGLSSYCYGGGPYDYDELGLADRFFNIVHAADQPLWEGCTQSQLGVVTELVDIKADGHISKGIYDRISQWANRILPFDHSSERLLQHLEDDVDLKYCKFCGDARYNPSRGRNPHRKKSSYVVLRYLSTTPHLQRLNSSRATIEHMTWHATYLTENRSMCHPSDVEAWKHFDRMYPNFAEKPRNV
ncbi:UNVERIFIED_CONTAM: hypothetical protein Sangu_2418800 [Sesamum angustifolium]|uniref:Transposase-associated domain-containing protein n=1 Tax=Sesamum angustifolium TaxID=2727405 RepID=A0AAW2KYH0_9LAMI